MTTRSVNYLLCRCTDLTDFAYQWANGRRGEDGWGKWTRRRKWYRDAELVEEDEVPEQTAAAASAPDLTTQSYSTAGEKMFSPTQATMKIPEPTPQKQQPEAQLSSSAGSRSFFRKPLMRRSTNQSVATTASAATSAPAGEGQPADGGEEKRRRGRRLSEPDSEADAEVDEVGLRVNLALQGQTGASSGWGIGDEARMNLE